MVVLSREPVPAPKTDWLSKWEERRLALEEELEQTSPFSVGDKVIIDESVAPQMDYLPPVFKALSTGSRIGTISRRQHGEGQSEHTYMVVLDDVPIRNIYYSESELSLYDPVEIVELDQAIAEAEAALETLKEARNKLSRRLKK